MCITTCITMPGHALNLYMHNIPSLLELLVPDEGHVGGQHHQLPGGVLVLQRAVPEDGGDTQRCQ